jgi:hypothetical protein
MKTCMSIVLLLISCSDTNNKHTNTGSKLVDTSTTKTSIVSEFESRNTRIVGKIDTSIIVLKKIPFTLLSLYDLDNNKRELLIQQNGKTKHIIKLFTQDDYMGFSINWIKEIEKGFEISIEYSGAGHFFNKDFQFKYQENTFILKKIKVHYLFNRDNINDSSEYHEKFKKPLSIDSFDMANFINAKVNEK